jgi:hypothetical protein
MDEEQNQVADDAASSADAGALSETDATQASQAASSDDGATAAQEPTVEGLRRELEEHKASSAEREKKWQESYRGKESELNKVQERLAPYERAAQQQQEEVEKINDAFIARASEIGYPAAFSELTRAQQQHVEAETERRSIVDGARQKFLDAGKMPADFDKFYGSRSWANKADFLADVALHLDKEHVTKTTTASKEAMAREADEKARRDAANKQPGGGGSPSTTGASDHPGQSVLDGMATAARQMNAAQEEL